MKVTKRCLPILSSVVKELKIVRGFGKSSSPSQVQEAIEIKDCSATAQWENAYPYEAIPGPKPLPIPRGNVWRFLPYGTYYNMSTDELYDCLHKEYGPIVKLTGVNSTDVIVLFTPQDTATMFRNESSMPIRDGLSCFNYYRRVYRKEWFPESTGLLTSGGEEWYQFRKIVNQPMIQPRSAKMYIQPVGEVADCFVERMKKLRDSNLEMPEDFLHELEKWALESIGVIALDARLGCLEDNLPEDSEAVRIVRATKELFDVIFVLETKMTPWQYVWTPAFGRFVRIMDFLSQVARKRISERWEEMKKKDPNSGGNPSVLQNIMLRSNNQHVAFTMAMDMLLAGIDTTASVLANLLYMLAKNPDKQEKLFEELREIMPKKDHQLTSDNLNDAKYLKMCIKETHRLSPLVVGTQRLVMNDVVMSNYQVPKGTRVVCHNQIMCKQEMYFKKANEYIPERWLKSEKRTDSPTDPFLFLPFGFGPRMCIGRRFAELELQTLAAKIVRNFKISYFYGDMTWKAWILRTPNKPLKFRMEDRRE